MSGLVESAIRESCHFPHAAARRTSFDALVQDYTNAVLKEPGRFDIKERATRERQLKWWSRQFARLSLAEVTARISVARDALAQETFTRGNANQNASGKRTKPERYPRSGATINRYIAALSHALSFAVKDRRLLNRNPVSDIRRKKEPPGRTRFLSDEERTALLKASGMSAWPALRTLVLLAITTGARKRELIRSNGLTSTDPTHAMWGPRCLWRT